MFPADQKAVIPAAAPAPALPIVHASPISQPLSGNRGSGQVVAQGNEVAAKVQVNPTVSPHIQVSPTTTATVAIFNSKVDNKIGEHNDMKNVTINNAPSCRIL